MPVRWWGRVAGTLGPMLFGRVGYMLGGGLILGVVGAAVGPPDDWGGPGWPARLEFAAMCGLGGAVGGLRFWAIDQDD